MELVREEFFQIVFFMGMTTNVTYSYGSRRCRHINILHPL
jgi:hypothetical protein